MDAADVNVRTTDDFTKCVGALVYYIVPENYEECKIAYPNLLFGRNIIDGCGVMCSVLTLTVGEYHGMGDVEYGKIYDIYFPPELLRLFDGPSCNTMHGHDERERLHRRRIHEVRGCAGALHRPGERGVQDRLPEPALRPQHHLRPWHDVLRADPEHRS